MVNEITVSREVMADLLTAKSKLTDVKFFADEHKVILERFGLLEELEKILNATTYTEEM